MRPQATGVAGPASGPHGRVPERAVGSLSCWRGACRASARRGGTLTDRSSCHEMATLLANAALAAPAARGVQVSERVGSLVGEASARLGIGTPIPRCVYLRAWRLPIRSEAARATASEILYGFFGSCSESSHDSYILRRVGPFPSVCRAGSRQARERHQVSAAPPHSFPHKGQACQPPNESVELRILRPPALRRRLTSQHR